MPVFKSKDELGVTLHFTYAELLVTIALMEEDLADVRAFERGESTTKERAKIYTNVPADELEVDLKSLMYAYVRWAENYTLPAEADYPVQTREGVRLPDTLLWRKHFGMKPSNTPVHPPEVGDMFVTTTTSVKEHWKLEEIRSLADGQTYILHGGPGKSVWYLLEKDFERLLAPETTPIYKPADLIV